MAKKTFVERFEELEDVTANVEAVISDMTGLQCVEDELLIGMNNDIVSFYCYTSDENEPGDIPSELYESLSSSGKGISVDVYISRVGRPDAIEVGLEDVERRIYESHISSLSSSESPMESGRKIVSEISRIWYEMQDPAHQYDEAKYNRDMNELIPGGA